MPEDTFYKILCNLASDAEKKEFFSDLENDPEKLEEFYHYKNIYVLSNLNPENYKPQQKESFARFWDSVQAKKSDKILKLWLRYAAIFISALVIGVLADSVLNHKDLPEVAQHIKYSSEKGSVSTIHLDDGSSIWLSSGTNLVLDKNRNGETIAHLDGEAYFDLVPNPGRKFVVDLGQFKVRDIGTRFNIRAYQSEQSILTTLVEGQIDLINNTGNSILKVKPGEFVKYDKSNKEISVQQCDPAFATAWKEGKFVFIDKTLSEICNELENWYNIEIKIDDPQIANTRYTSVVKRSTTVQMVLKILAVTDQIHYEITERKEGKDIIKISK